MGEHDISPRGEQSLYEARNGIIRVLPMFTILQNISEHTSDNTSTYELVAREILQHAHDYKTQLVPSRTRKADRHNEEGSIISVRLGMLEDAIREEGFDEVWNDSMGRDFQGDLTDNSASYFWPSIQQLFQEHPNYLKNNVFLTLFGNDLHQRLGTNAPRWTRTEEIQLVEEYKFKGPVFQTIRYEMREIGRSLDHM